MRKTSVYLPEDTSGLVALFNRAEPTHAAVAAAVRAARAHFEVVRAADGAAFDLLP